MKSIKLFGGLGILVSTVVSIGIQAQSPEKPTAKSDVKSLMHTFYVQMAKLRPYIVSEVKIKDPKATKEIDTALDEMLKRVKDALPEAVESTPGFRITYGLIESHLEKTKEVLGHGELEYARLRLNATTNFCIHCHTQIPESSKGGMNISSFIDEDEAPSMANAEFLFIFRRFDDALSQYDKLAREFPKSDVTSDQLNQLYSRKLAIFARIKRDAKEAVANLKEDLKNQELPADTRKNIQSWIAYFESWKKEKINPAKLSDKELVKFVAEKVPDGIGRKIAPDNPDAVNYLRLSGLLFERLMAKPTGTLVPEMLYQLARCEKHVSAIYWYPMGDIYLKECIQKYPRQAITKKCFAAYEQAMQDRYFGQGRLPEHVQRSIEALKGFL